MKSRSRSQKSTMSCLQSCADCKYTGECRLEKGAAVEQEHLDLYNAIKRYGLPPKEDFFKAIAAAHLQERPDYYERLARYVE